LLRIGAKMSTKLHIIGAAGYGAGDILRYLDAHPHVEIGTLESGSSTGEFLGDVFPELRRFAAGSRKFSERGSVSAAAQADDLVVCAGSHELAQEVAPQFLARGARVLDLSDNYRLDWQNRDAVYGFTERYRDRIRTARLVANPGCFPTTTLLALAPLRAFAANIATLVLDIKSGISGAGRTPRTGSLFAELDGEVRAYGLAGHRHIPEIAQELDACGITAPFTFTPQVAPFTRGMLGCIYVIFSLAPSLEEIDAAYYSAYAGSPFVRLLAPERAPSLRAVAHSNDAEISYTLNGNTLRILCGIDNLGKGAAGQAVQNINVMYNYPEETALNGH
jgi:N-acetyl-gamma-glutamyl-phosphate reductase